MDYEVPDVPGFREYWGRQVYYCPFCHGWDATAVEPETVAELRTEGGTVRALALNDGSDEGLIAASLWCVSCCSGAALRRRTQR